MVRYPVLYLTQILIWISAQYGAGDGTVQAISTAPT